MFNSTTAKPEESFIDRLGEAWTDPGLNMYTVGSIGGVIIICCGLVLCIFVIKYCKLVTRRHIHGNVGSAATLEINLSRVKSIKDETIESPPPHHVTLKNNGIIDSRNSISISNDNPVNHKIVITPPENDISYKDSQPNHNLHKSKDKKSKRNKHKKHKKHNKRHKHGPNHTHKHGHKHSHKHSHKRKNKITEIEGDTETNINSHEAYLNYLKNHNFTTYNTNTYGFYHMTNTAPTNTINLLYNTPGPKNAAQIYASQHPKNKNINVNNNNLSQNTIPIKHPKMITHIDPQYTSSSNMIDTHSLTSFYTTSEANTGTTISPSNHSSEKTKQNNKHVKIRKIEPTMNSDQNDERKHKKSTQNSNSSSSSGSSSSSDSSNSNSCCGSTTCSSNEDKQHNTNDKNNRNNENETHKSSNNSNDSSNNNSNNNNDNKHNNDRRNSNDSSNDNIDDVIVLENEDDENEINSSTEEKVRININEETFEYPTKIEYKRVDSTDIATDQIDDNKNNTNNTNKNKIKKKNGKKSSSFIERMMQKRSKSSSNRHVKDIVDIINSNDNNNKSISVSPSETEDGTKMRVNIGSNDFVENIVMNSPNSNDNIEIKLKTDPTILDKVKTPKFDIDTYHPQLTPSENGTDIILKDDDNTTMVFLQSPQESVFDKNAQTPSNSFTLATTYPDHEKELSNFSDSTLLSTPNYRNHYKPKAKDPTDNPLRKLENVQLKNYTSNDLRSKQRDGTSGLTYRNLSTNKFKTPKQSNINKTPKNKIANKIANKTPIKKTKTPKNNKTPKNKNRSNSNNHLALTKSVKQLKTRTFNNNNDNDNNENNSNNDNIPNIISQKSGSISTTITNTSVTNASDFENID